MRQQAKTVTISRVGNAASMTVLLIALAFADLIQAHADGGTVQFQKSAGPFVITVFTTPTPLRAGPVDVSVMIQSREDHQPVFDCQALIQLRKEGRTSIRSEATRDAAQNKLLYAAQVNVPGSGLWELEAEIRHGNDLVKVAGDISVAPSSSVLVVYWPSLALPPLFISLFVVNQWLKRRSTKGGRR